MLLAVPVHNSRHSSAYLRATCPLVPKGLLWFNSHNRASRRKYIVSGFVLLTACRAAFMKQVLPRLWSPVAPAGRTACGALSWCLAPATRAPSSSGHVRSALRTSSSTWSPSRIPRSCRDARSSSKRINGPLLDDEELLGLEGGRNEAL